MCAAIPTKRLSVCAIVDGKPHRGMVLPLNVVYVGMEAEPNRPPRYGKMFHPWFNLPCYETIEGKR